MFSTPPNFYIIIKLAVHCLGIDIFCIFPPPVEKKHCWYSFASAMSWTWSIEYHSIKFVDCLTTFIFDPNTLLSYTIWVKNSIETCGPPTFHSFFLHYLIPFGPLTTVDISRLVIQHQTFLMMPNFVAWKVQLQMHYLAPNIHKWYPSNWNKQSEFRFFTRINYKVNSK